MGTIRYFSGGRDHKVGKRSSAGGLLNSNDNPAAAIMRLQIMKKGKMPTQERYRMLLKKKLEENKKKAMNGHDLKPGFKLPGSVADVRKMSKRTEEALKQIAMKKAAKEEKRLRKMVFVTPRTYTSGRITEKGAIYDVAGNKVAYVNRKNGKIATVMGWSVGKYKAKSYLTDILVQDTIQQHSPYFINLRKMQALQAGSGGVWGQTPAEPINVYGWSPQHAMLGGNGQQFQHDYSPAPAQEQGSVYGKGGDFYGRNNVGATAWGVMADNPWGNFADNAWGTMVDNVWGGTDNNVWGGVGVGGSAGSLWGAKSAHVWGTGTGKNYLKGLTSRVAAFFGLKTSKSGGRTAGSGSGRTAGSSGRSSGGSGRTAATVARSAPSVSRRS